MQVAAITHRPVSRALPLHRCNPVWQTALGAAEVIAFVALVATGSAAALAAWVLATVGFLGAYVADSRAVAAFETDTEGTLIAATRSGRPTVVVGSVRADRPLPSSPRGLAAPVLLDGRRWWVDRVSFGALRGAAAPEAGPRSAGP